MLANKKNGTLYLGVTSNLVKRVWEHKNNAAEGFSQKYHTYNLVWFEIYENMESAISREKTLKKWHRDWKIQLIEKENNGWLDLYSNIC